MNNVLVSRKSDEWRTPKEIYEYFRSMGYFDPCPINHVVNGLLIEWKKDNFVNPPYSQLKKWVEKAIKEYWKFRKVVLLIPARTDTKAFKMLSECNGSIRFVTGRLKFNDLKEVAPFPSMFVILDRMEDQRTIEDVRLIDKNYYKEYIEKEREF